MTRTLRAPFLALSLAMAMMFAFAMPAAAQTHEGLTTDITDQVLEQGGFESGNVVLTITEVARDGSDLVFSGTIVGEVVDDGETIPVNETFTSVPGEMEPGGEGNGNRRCDILFLDLGPINLDVLGLVVDLSDVQLDIFAVPGAGNLLGNLLCAVAGLLDGPGLIGGIGNAIDNLLDRVTGILDGLLG
jgi:hypothetical protein